jgi:predicted dehydrogenase
MKVRWGIVSTANIGVKKVIPAMQRGRYSEVAAIASREQARADAAASALGIPKAYGSYRALLEAPDIDAVYIPTPNHLHVPLSIEALEAGKHVLVEKPVGLSADEADTLRAAAARDPSLKVMEAFMYRHHPQWVRARQIVHNGEIGDLRTIHTFFSYYDVNPMNVRNMGDIGGGGGLMDIGCYPVSLSRFIFGEEPKRVLGIAEFDPVFKVDILASGIMEFERGTATFTCATQLVPFQRVLIYGTEGYVEIEIPFNAPPNGSHRLWHHRRGHTETVEVGGHDQYTIQGDLFSRAVLEDTDVPTPLTDAVANMRVIDSLFRSAAASRWTTPAGS